MKMKIEGILPALVTPFHADGKVNHGALEQLLDRVYTAGVDGVYVCGSTGEGVLLDETDRRAIAETVVRNSPGGKHAVVHVGSGSLDLCIRLARHAESLQAAAISCIRPPGVNLGEMLTWYRTLASCTTLPFIAYYFPAISGEHLNVDQLGEICEMPGVGGIKFTDFDLYTLSLLSRAGYRIFNGRDEVLTAGLLMGACGGIGSLYNLIPACFVQLQRHACAGDWAAARSLQDRINDLLRVLQRFPFLPAIKQVLTWEGIDCGKSVDGVGLSPAEQTILRESLAPLQMFGSC